MGNNTRRYCIISFCNIYILPYAKKYIDAIVANGAECTLLYWDRDATNGLKDDFDNCEKKCFPFKITNESSMWKKLKGYLGAVLFIRKELKKANYDGAFFLQTHAAVACHSILRKKYNKKYVVDIRDWTLENIGLYRMMEKWIINHAYATVISSPAYKEFLPKGDYTVAHNYTPFDDSVVRTTRNNCRLGEKKNRISLSFVGTVRFIEMDKKILNLFANDDRFIINYYGTGSDVLEKYCKNNKIKNVDFYGSFPPEKTESFYHSTDLINNLYGNNTPFLDYALSNKLYHSAQLGIPILVCPKTYMEKVVDKYNMGFVLDVDNSQEPDRLFDWYISSSKVAFLEGCDRFLRKVQEDNVVYYDLIDDFVKTKIGE